MTITTATPYTVADFVRDRVQRTRIVGSSARQLLLSRLFPVRGLTPHGSLDGSFHRAPITGWWAFLHDKETILGIAEVAMTAHAIVFSGINTGAVASRAAQAVRQAEVLAVDTDAAAWFVNSPATFFTALVVELPEGPTTLPIIGPPQPDMQSIVRDTATRRLERHARKPHRRRAPANS